MLHPARSPIIKPPRGALINRQLPLSRNLISAHIANGNSGKLLFDSSGNGAHGNSWIGTPSWGPGGIDFDYSGPDAIECIYNANQNINNTTGRATIFARIWYRDNSVNEYQYLWFFGETGSSNQEYSLAIRNSDRTFTWGHAGTYGNMGTPSQIPSESWCDIAITFENNTIGGIRSFVNGVYKDSNNCPNGQSRPNNRFVIAARRNSATPTYSIGWDGYIECIYVWDRILSEDEIAFLHREPYAVFQQLDKTRFFASASAGTTETVTASIDALIKRTGITSVVSVDALVQQSAITKTAALDALVKILQTSSVSVDAMVKAVKSGVLSIDALIQTAQSATAALDAIVKARKTSAVSLDAIILGALHASVGLDALVQITAGQSISLDAIIGAASMAPRQVITLAMRTKQIIMSSRTKIITLN